MSEERQHTESIELALNCCRAKRERDPHFFPLKTVEEQLLFLLDFMQGRSSDMKLLANINIGLFAAREFEARDMKFAEQIYKVVEARDYLLKRGAM